MDFEDILNQWDKKIDNTKAVTKKKVLHKKNSEQNNKIEMSSFLDLYPPDEDSAEGEPEIITQRQKRRNYRRMKPQETLDLHGFTLVSAIIELEDFLQRCRRRKIEKVLIIHGKGLHSTDGISVLRNGIRAELKSLSYIGEVGHPSEKEGGAGASWAVIKY